MQVPSIGRIVVYGARQAAIIAAVRPGMVCDLWLPRPGGGRQEVKAVPFGQWTWRAMIVGNGPSPSKATHQ